MEWISYIEIIRNESNTKAEFKSHQVLQAFSLCLKLGITYMHFYPKLKSAHSARCFQELFSCIKRIRCKYFLRHMLAPKFLVCEFCLQYQENRAKYKKIQKNSSYLLLQFLQYAKVKYQ